MRLLCPLICFCGQGGRDRHDVMFVAAQTSICRSAQSSLNLRVEKLMKNLLAITVGMTSTLLIDSALAQNGNMMNGRWLDGWLRRGMGADLASDRCHRPRCLGSPAKRQVSEIETSNHALAASSRQYRKH